MIMRSLTDGYTLPGGIQLPCVGFGTWQAPSGEIAKQAVLTALRAGYRHIDTAAGYGNEQSVGEAMRESGIPREQIFLTTKLNNPDHGYEATKAAFEKSMKALDVDYLDLYLIHWPNPISCRAWWKQANAESWRAMEEFHRQGRIRTIGVSNFMPRHLDALSETWMIPPMVNQIRLFPGETQEETVAYCKQMGIVLEAYSPFGTGLIFDSPELIAMAKKYDKTIAQICIRWSLQSGYVPLPKSVTNDRIIENADVFDFELSAEDLKALTAMPNYCGPTRNPDEIPF